MPDETPPAEHTTDPAPPAASAEELEAQVQKLVAEVARLNHPGTYPSGLVVRENTPEQGGGFSAYFEKAGTPEHPETVEFSYVGTGESAPEAVQSLCEGFADCIRARDGRMAAMEEALQLHETVSRETPVSSAVDPSASPIEFDKQVEAARAEHVRLLGRRPGQR